MARIRTVKPAFWSDERVADLSRDARLLCVGLISFADDEGRFVASTAAIRGYVYPHDNISLAKIQQWLTELEATGIVLTYTVNSHQYGMFPNYRRHQKINRPTPSTFPPPNGHNH